MSDPISTERLTPERESEIGRTYYGNAHAMKAIENLFGEIHALRATPVAPSGEAVTNIQVCWLPYQDAPFVHGTRAGRDVWLRRDGTWSETDGDPECSLDTTIPKPPAPAPVAPSGEADARYFRLREFVLAQRGHAVVDLRCFDRDHQYRETHIDNGGTMMLCQWCGRIAPPPAEEGL